MITIFTVIVVALLTIVLNIAVLIFVVPPLNRFMDKLFRGEVIINIFQMFIICFVMGVITLGFFALIAKLF